MSTLAISLVLIPIAVETLLTSSSVNHYAPFRLCRLCMSVSHINHQSCRYICIVILTTASSCLVYSYRLEA